MEEFESINLNKLFTMRQLKNSIVQDNNSFDPYQTMINRNNNDVQFIQYNPEDIKQLENFCNKHGILGINFRNVDPVSTLKMLKSRIGMVEENISEKNLLLD